MGKSDPPPPPDPRETASAQTGTNVGTAIANSVLGMVDQVTPYGTLTYEQMGSGTPLPDITTSTTTTPGTGGQWVGGRRDGYRTPGTGGGTQTLYNVGDNQFSSMAEAEAFRDSQNEGSYTYTDPYTGETYNIPRFKSTIELTPQQQATLDASQSAQGNLANLADERSAFLRDYLPQTESLTDQIGGRLYDMGAQRIDPRFAREEEALRTRLANQGIAPGSEAYSREVEALGQTKNDAYNQLMLQGRAQAQQEINNPLNQITALLSGSQVTNPQVQMQNPARIPTTDVAGIINNNYAQQMNAWGNQQQQRNSMLGGLFGAGATLLGAPQGSVFGSLF